MRIKNVVKVMNFHSLLRVDASKREAESYRNVGDEITKIIKTIVYNKNLVLDKKVIMPNPNNNKLNIYIANDYGFCGNFNSQIARQIRQDKDDYKIIIGKKIVYNDDKVILKIILTTTPIIPLIVVTLVFCIENNDEFKISLTPVNGNTNEYPKKALAVIFTAASLKLPLS